MIKIVTVIGARPQIIKAAAVSRAIRTHFPDEIREVIVHTGQHYDPSMSDIFFEELGIPLPDYNLHVGSATHAKQTAMMMTGVEEVLFSEKPDCVLLYGDTNSTLAGALAAVKLHVPVVHVEAGLRSFNKQMPEEINRIVCDHCATILFTPTLSGMANLQKEGFELRLDTPVPTADHPHVYHCGDVMYDNSLWFQSLAKEKSFLKYPTGNFLLCTIHRDSNTDNPVRFAEIFSALIHLAEHEKINVLIPLHPRASSLLEKNLAPEVLQRLRQTKKIHILPPVSYLDMILLETKAEMILTDSGGVQKEAFFFRKPCIILRSETEWTELVENGNAVIADADSARIIAAYGKFKKSHNFTYPPFYGNGDAAEFICRQLIGAFKSSK